MEWIEIRAYTTPEAAEAISELFMAKGANGTEMVDPYAFRQVLENNEYLDYADEGLIESYGQDIIIKAWFPAVDNPDELVRELKNSLKNFGKYFDLGLGKIEYEKRDDSEWKDNWKAYFKPFKLTESIVVKPSWENYNPKDQEIVIEIDPGMAFGTGTHVTTSMCANLGEKYLTKGDRVLDLGCGTAILALSAVKLGASSALAVDIDDQAVKTAEINIEKNGESNRIEVLKGAINHVPERTFDLIFVNIIADIIIEISEHIKKYTHSNTRIILSGIIKNRRKEVIEAYVSKGFTIIEELIMGEWAAVVLHA
jgi:ribosomal protein L11 methyltransferase